MTNRSADTNQTTSTHPIARLVVAVGASVLALLINLFLSDLVRGNTGAIFLLAVIAATWFGGTRASLLAIVLTTAGNLYAITVHESVTVASSTTSPRKIPCPR